MAQPSRVAAFHALHADGTFVMPNPWDIGSARLLEGLRFKALATTSAGFAWSIGRADNHAPLDAMLGHLRAIAEAVAVPINADFEGGFAADPDGVAANVAAAVRTGIAGISIEDSSGDPDEPLYAFDLAVDRIRAARRAIDESGTGVLLTGRSEGFLVGRPDIDETIRRLRAYADAGADCLYAPWVRSEDEIAAIVQAAAPKPVNVLVGTDFTTVADLSRLGVRRISTGGALARTAWTAFREAATEIATEGTFGALGRTLPGAELDALFGAS